MKCQYCKKDFSKYVYQQGITYEGIDEHHNPPIFMLKKWEGEIINLCRKHHRDLHDEILKIMFKHSNLRTPKKSEYWTWIAIIPFKRKDCINEVVTFTKGWLK